MRRFDSSLHIPKYILLKEEIRKLIKEKHLKPHDKLLSRNELVRDYDVSEITVRKAIDELTNEGYVYRIHGKGTFVAEARNDSLTIAMMALHVYAMSDARYMYDVGFVSPIIHSVQREACNQNASMLLYLNHDDVEIEKQNLANVQSRGVDGIVILPRSESHNAECMAQRLREGIPVVAIDRVMRGVDADSVISDNETGAYLATKTLIDAGFNKVHYITPDEDVTTVHERTAGYIRAMTERGLPYENYMHVCVAVTNLKPVLKTVEPDAAVFAANAPMFVGVFNAMNELGMNIRNMGLACFDEPTIYVPNNVIFVKVLQPLEEMGTKCVQLIVDRIRGMVTEPQHIVLPCKLRISRNGLVEEVAAPSPYAAAHLLISQAK